MRPEQVGIWQSLDRLGYENAFMVAARAEALGYDTIWYPESAISESMVLGATLLHRLKRMNVGSSIANIYARDPMASGNGVRTLNALFPGRFTLGVGVSHAPVVQGMRGHVYEKPLAAMRMYLEAIYAGQHKLGQSTSLPIMIGALGPKMLDLSGELAQGALPYNVTPVHTAYARAALGPERRLVVEQKIALVTDPTEARRLARMELSRYMTLPNYRNNWLRIGFTEDDVSGEGSDRFMDGMVAWGTETAIRARIQEHLDAGADQVAIQPVIDHALLDKGDVSSIVTTLETLAPEAP
ncbi:MAG: TIGR03620 family F420-dependent LLM class oxidoreductase [Alphaproteobacteria bacterium]